MAGVDSSPTIDTIAAAAGIPLLTLRGVRRPEQRAAIDALSPSAIAVACCPWRLPAQLRALPPLGCLNVHPSLLPRWRGPEPLFWMFKQGDVAGGATVHLMDDGLDTGPILAQRVVPVSDLVDGAAFERQLADEGGLLLVEALHCLAAGSATLAAQDESRAIAAPSPVDADFTERSDRPAQALANLVAGIAPLWGPVLVESHLSGERIAVRRVLRVDPGASSGDAVDRSGNTVTFRCATGAVTFVAE
jgi:methionyl-tRNA formyltransferase